MVEAERFIRVKPETKEVLQTLKLVPRESYDDVIKRLIQGQIEAQLDINETLSKKLQERMDEVKKGKVMSSNEIYKKLYKKSR